VGVSVAVTVSSGVQMALLWYFLGLRIPSLRLREIASSAARTGVASALAVGAAHLAVGAMSISTSSGPLHRAWPGLAAAFAFMVVFAAAAALLKSAELEAILLPIRRRVGR